MPFIHPMLKRASIFILAIQCVASLSTFGQKNVTNVKLSLGANLGYAPILNYGSDHKTALTLSVLGDLQINNLIGRIQNSPVITKSLDSKHFNDGSALHGSIGYSFEISEKTSIPIMLGGGASFISYSVSVFGSQGDTFFDVSPQIGLIISPKYQINNFMDLQFGARYFKGFKVAERSRAINLGEISAGLMFKII